MGVAIVFFFNDTATTEIYTLSLHDALPISTRPRGRRGAGHHRARLAPRHRGVKRTGRGASRSEEHTSELQSHLNLVCRLLLEKKKHLRSNPPPCPPPNSPPSPPSRTPTHPA